MPDYRANWKIINHNGRDIEPGQVVTFPPDEAKQFVDCGALSEVSPVQTPPEQPTT